MKYIELPNHNMLGEKLLVAKDMTAEPLSVRGKIAGKVQVIILKLPNQQKTFTGTGDGNWAETIIGRPENYAA